MLRQASKSDTYMKLISFLSSSSLLLISSFGFAQEQAPTKKCRMQIQDVFLNTGVFLEQNGSGMLSDFRTLAPQSAVLNTMNDVSNSDGFTIMGNSSFSALVGIKFKNKNSESYKSNPLLRLGISYFTGSALSYSTFNDTRKPFDTLTSAQTGQTIYIDSLSYQSHTMNYTSEQLRLDVSVLFRTNPEARWSVFGGLGITAGLSLNANTHIHYNKFDRTEARFPNGNNSFTNSSLTNETRITERFQNSNNFGASAYIPMGVDFRIGKKREFWKQMHLFYELRPGINTVSIPELRTLTNASMQHGIGLRVSWI